MLHSSAGFWVGTSTLSPATTKLQLPQPGIPSPAVFQEHGDPWISQDPSVTEMCSPKAAAKPWATGTW